MKKTELKIPSSEDLKSAIQTKKLEPGLLGKFFGGSETNKTNIAGLILSVLVLAGLIATFVNFDKNIEFWKIITPIITLILGYMFGKQEK